jgi:protein subunit release factor A
MRIIARADSSIARLEELRELGAAAKTLQGPAFRDTLAEGHATYSEISAELERANQQERTESIRKWADRARDAHDAYEAADEIKKLAERKDELEEALKLVEAYDLNGDYFRYNGAPADEH